MKNIKYIIVLFFIVIVSMTSCKDFLERTPLDQVSDAVYFKKTADLELYVNWFYRPLQNIFEYGETFAGWNYSSLIFLMDYDSDNFTVAAANDRLKGIRTVPSSGGGYSFSNVRRINYFFDNYKKCEDDFAQWKHYLGEAHFFRAAIYFDLVKRFGDFPLDDKVLTTTSPELYEGRTPRNIVMDHIIADLDSAAMYLDNSSRDGGNRLDKWCALTLQSRVALYEGTWEKYHNGTAFGVQNANPQKYLTKAAQAAEEIMNSGEFGIYSTGNPNNDYYQLFDIHNYTGNKEIIMWKKFDKGLGIYNQRMSLGAWPRGYGITKGLADSYLCTDGLPIQVSPLFLGHNTLADESSNRDPRFKQTIFTQDAPYAYGGITYPNWGEGMYNKLFSAPDYTTTTGYVRRKGTTTDMSKQNLSGEDEPIILYDYAEVLLNYAEAKAELGTITQTDIDRSIKLLRDRVGMPNLVIGSIVTDPNWDFPTLSPIINEVRRERRVELSLSGLRWADVARWAAADELITGKRPKGSQWGSTFAANPFQDDADGFMDPFIDQLPTGYGFKLDRDYLDPLPQSELTINPNLVQNPGW